MFCHGQVMVKVQWQKRQAYLCTKCGQLTTYKYIAVKGTVQLIQVWPPRRYGTLRGVKKRVKCS